MSTPHPPAAGIRSWLDRAALRRAVIVTIVLAVPPLVIVRIIKGNDLAGRESNLWVVAVLAVMVAYLIGGIVAALGSRDLHLTHSASAAGYAFAMMAVGSALIGLFFSAHQVLSGAFVLVLLAMGTLCVSAATFGGYAVVRWREWRR